MAEPRYGVYLATIAGVDPERPGWAEVKLTALGVAASARLATATAVTPGDEVLVAFESGDARRAYVIGALWSGDEPPSVRG